MDREKLARIDENVDELAKEFRAFISSEGPFVDVRERVRLLEDKTDGLWARVTGIITAVMGIAWVVITKFVGGGNG